MALWPERLQQHLDCPVAILGWGISGRAAGQAVRAAGGHAQAYDRAGPEGSSRDFTAKDAARHRLVLFSPGFHAQHPWLEIARAEGCACLPEMDLGALLWPGAVLVVTGTNGKTTLTEFLAHALRTDGMEAVACGNQGYPLTCLHERVQAEDTVAVVEVSSFQAETLQHLRPHALLWTNFDEDHLDRHGNMTHYFEAKWRLVGLLRRPRLVVGKTVASWARREGKQLPLFTVVADAESARGSLPPGSALDSGPQRENWAVARAYWEQEGFEPGSLQEAVRSFELPRHRLAQVRVVEGVRFWNDSKSTNFLATLAALEHFERPVWWIGGGRGKGGDLAAFVRALAPRIRGAFLIGETAPAIACQLEDAAIAATVCENLQQAVAQAFTAAATSDTVVFSPGFSSHDLFANYAERGVAFEGAVDTLLKVPSETPNPR